MAYTLMFDEAALKEWQALDGSVKTPLKKVLMRRLESPHVPGDALRGVLAGYYRIKLRKFGYRLVYRVEDKTVVVIVLAVGKRENDMVYLDAASRLTKSKSALIEPSTVEKRKRRAQ
jgi:mRNA interferase RelE/StbE